MLDHDTMGQPVIVLAEQVSQDEPAQILSDWGDSAVAPSDPLAAVLSVISQAVGADTLLAIWHDDGELPLCMGWNAGRTAKAGLATEMAKAAGRVASTGMEQVDWCARVKGDHGMMTIGFPMKRGAVTVTALYPSIGEMTHSLEAKMAVRKWPILAAFFRLWVRNFRSNARANGFASATDQLDLATFHFDDRGRLLFSNKAGEALIAKRNGLRRSGVSLGGSSLSETIALQSAVDDAILDEDPVENGNRLNPIVALSRPGRRPLLAHAVSIGRDTGGSRGVAAILHVVDPDRELHSQLTPVCAFYGLSPVETKLAHLLANGATLADAGKQINVREQTVRSYLKQIFAKTRTTRQAELVRLILKSSTMTIPS